MTETTITEGLWRRSLKVMRARPADTNGRPIALRVVSWDNEDGRRDYYREPAEPEPRAVRWCVEHDQPMPAIKENSTPP